MTDKIKMVNTTAEITNDLAVLPIGAVADAINVHQRTLRIYDKAGILVPRRTSKNRRNYSINDIEKAKVILFLTRNMALNISGVKIILAMLEEMKIQPKQYIDFITKVAAKAKIDTEAQIANIEKTSRRGRRPKKSE